MTVPINDDFAGRELCANELDAVSAAGFLGLGAIVGVLPHNLNLNLPKGGGGGCHGPHQPLPFPLPHLPLPIPIPFLGGFL